MYALTYARVRCFLLGVFVRSLGPVATKYLPVLSVPSFNLRRHRQRRIAQDAPRENRTLLSVCVQHVIIDGDAGLVGTTVRGRTMFEFVR